MHQLGKGVPDLLIGVNGYNFLLKIKQEKNKKLTPDETIWHQAWQGQVAVVGSVEEAVEIFSPSTVEGDNQNFQLRLSKVENTLNQQIKSLKSVNFYEYQQFDNTPITGN